MFDWILRNGTVIDGRNRPRFVADVGIQGERIAAIGDLAGAEAAQVVDAAGLVVTPGFIDVHTHSDGWLLKEPHLLSKTRQGFTTELLMLDGISYAPVNALTWREWFAYLRPLNGLQLADYTGWETIGDYLALLDGRIAQNCAAFIPYANVRTLACGFGQRTPDDFQLFQIKRLIEQGMADGALGISTGLDYLDECWASTDELVAACQMMGPQGVYVTHVRYLLGTLAGVQEAVAIGKRAGVPVHISHLKATSEAEAEEILHYIDTVAVHEVDFSFDVYPYLPSSTMLQYLLPHAVWRDGPLTAVAKLTDPRIRADFARDLADMDLATIHIAWVGSKANSQYQGRTLADYIATVGKPTAGAGALCDLLIEEGMAVLLVFNWGDDRLVEPFLAHDRYMMGSDGIYFPDGVVHPRQYGSAPRLLRHGLDGRLFGLETAVHKLSGYAAARFGLTGRGVLAEGAFADVLLLDPERVAERATFGQPHQLAEGVGYVWVNGRLILQDGQPVAGALPGRVIGNR